MESKDCKDSLNAYKQFQKRQALINHCQQLGARIPYENLSGIGFAHQFANLIPPNIRTIQQMESGVSTIKNLGFNIQPMISAVGNISKMGISFTPPMIAGAVQIAKTSAVINQVFEGSPIIQITQNIIDTSPAITSFLNTPNVTKNAWSNIGRIKTDILLDESKKLKKKNIIEKDSVLIVDGDEVIIEELEKDTEQLLLECGFSHSAEKPIVIVKSLNNLIINVKDKEEFKLKKSLITLGHEILTSLAKDIIWRILGL